MRTSSSLHEPFGLGNHSAAIELPNRRDRQLPAQKQIHINGLIVGEREVLVDDLDAVRLRVAAVVLRSHSQPRRSGSCAAVSAG